MGGLPRPVILAHRFSFAAFLLYMTPALWRLFSRPVTMLSDFPITAFALVLAVAGLLLSWLNGFKANCLLLLCDALLIVLAVLYFFQN